MNGERLVRAARPARPVDAIERESAEAAVELVPIERRRECAPGADHHAAHRPVLPNQGEADPTKDGPAIEGWTWSPDGRSIVLWPGPGARPLVVDVGSDTATELPWESDSAPSWQRLAADR